MPSSFLGRLGPRPADGEKAVVFDGGRGVSMLQIRTNAVGLAEALGSRPLRVALLGTPSAEWVSAFVGILLSGSVAVPLTGLYPDAELRQLLAEGEIELLVATADLEERARGLSSTIAVSVAPLLVAGAAEADRGWEDRVASLSDDAAALMLFTSGTTGRPKGARLTHRNLSVQLGLLGEAWGIGPSDALLHMLPLHHTHGLVVALLTCLGAGAGVHLRERFDAGSAWEVLARGEITLFMGVPTMYQRLIEAWDGADEVTRGRWGAGARRLRLATSGSAALPATLAARWKEVAGAIPLERYGMTEIGMALSNPLEASARRPGRVGAALPTVEVRLVDEAGAVVEEGPGELWVRGPSVFAGYFGRADATAEAFSSDGWFKTGDIAEVDADGSHRLLGRTSVDILKSGGYKLSALEIEEVLREHPAIAEVAVVGLPDATWGDRVVAVVRPHDGLASACETEAVRSWAKSRMAPYKVPRQVVRVDSLPKNAMGKVQKAALVQAIGAAAQAPDPPRSS